MPSRCSAYSGESILFGDHTNKWRVLPQLIAALGRVDKGSHDLLERSA
jgi:hypothetical protein